MSLQNFEEKEIQEPTKKSSFSPLASAKAAARQSSLNHLPSLDSDQWENLELPPGPSHVSTSQGPFWPPKR